MPRLPPRSTLFPTRRSSDLSTFQIYLKIHASRGVGTMVVKISDLKKQLMTRIDKSDLIQVEKVDRYIQHIESYRRMEEVILEEGESVTTENGAQKFIKAHPLLNEKNKVNSAIINIERSFGFDEDVTVEVKRSKKDLI